MTNSLVRSFFLSLPLLAMVQSCDDKKNIKKDLQAEQQRSSDLLNEKSNLESAKSQLELDAAEDQKSIEDNQKKIDELKAAADRSAAEIEQLKKDNADLQSKVDQRNKDIAALQVKLNELDQKIAGLNSDIEARTKEINRLTADLTSSSSQIDKLKKDITDLQARPPVASASEELTNLQNQLTAEQQRNVELGNQIKSLDAELRNLKSQTPAVQVFLANAGKDSLFVVDADSIGDTFKVAEGQTCTIIFNLNRNIEVVRGPAQDRIPSLSDRDMLPLKGGYQKVAVCQTGDKIEAQIENGSVYQSIPNNSNTSIQLVSARETSTCDGNQTVFASTYQLFYPYRGEIDGIETIDMLRANNEMLRYNMASSSFDYRNASCTDVLKSSVATDLSKLACRLALGQDTGMPVTKGCFKEVTEEGATKLTFSEKPL